MSETPGSFAEILNYAPLSGQPILVGFNSGDYARDLEKLSDKATVDTMHGILRKIYGDDIPDPTGFKVTRWSQDPFAYGSYSFPVSGTGEARDGWFMT